ncbi:DUF294 nucleotidyltransferase-like domain-containing protein [Granulosicoccus antarcticus]|uniref:Hypoxic response protein 1 n=1 Tax=Granulosicoccus antarcticus IMCC3135 TaxID=1192854 RepID=A0A2Z2NRE1_9GAMM|nr:DUF294 nucleotidyltransferase-like domain-containing protein [Granulosicoccus antarcticus]ASJ73065.1 Hypoxic response protein 1 [Granulosicoccus antarcticus IMCC3135]
MNQPANSQSDVVAVDNANVVYKPQAVSVSVPDVAGSDRLTSVLVREVMSVDPLSVHPSESIQRAALRMGKHRISCLPVVEDGRLVGMVTESDFVSKVVAKSLMVTQPVSRVSTQQPHFVTPDQSVLDVLTLMTRHRIAHMPVCIDGMLVGIVTQTDVIRHQVATSVFMVGDIARMKSSTAIAAVVQELPRLLVSRVDSGSSAFETGRIISSITGAVTRRLIELAQEKLGPAPIAYAWLACGSQGRQEQTGATDQDNCLILSDDYEAEVHGEYFAKMAEFVCDGLNESGYVYCPGDMMASNPKWCQPVSVWRDYFNDWIKRPGPTAQMLASVMFDLRSIQGDMTLYEPLREELLASASSNSIFVAHMTSNCLTHRPPIGWFGRIKTASSGPHRGKIDLKHGGVVPIVDIARLYALSAAQPFVNTVQRLSASVDSGVLSQSGARSLCDAYEVISLTRLRHQVRQIKRAEPVDNHVDLATLSSSERDRLRHAMKTVKDIQAAMSNRIAMLGR